MPENESGLRCILTRTPSLMSSTSIRNLNPVLAFFDLFPTSDCLFPLENRRPSSRSTSLRTGKWTVSVDTFRCMEGIGGTENQDKPSVHPRFHRPQLVFSLSENINRFWISSPWI